MTLTKRTRILKSISVIVVLFFVPGCRDHGKVPVKTLTPRGTPILTPQRERHKFSGSVILRSNLAQEGKGHLNLLPNRDPIPLVASWVPSDASSAGANVESVTFTVRAKCLSPERPGVTGTFTGDPETGEFTWFVPEEDGFYMVWAVCSQVLGPTGASGGPSTATAVSQGLLFQVPVSGEKMTDGALEGVTLGVYPDPNEPGAHQHVKKYSEKYQRPAWFYRVDAKNKDYFITESFRLSDFDLTYDYWKPDYSVPYEIIALHPKLPEKLEMILAKVRERYNPEARFELLAGFRSPWFNEEVKRDDLDFSQSAKFSPHLYGWAADFIVDTDGDGVQDDLNGDGTIDPEDIREIEKIADEIDAESLPGESTLLGGFGVYPRHDIKMREPQTPYAHVDVRGYTNDNGSPVRWYIP